MKLKVNGETHDVSAPATKPLLWVLRDELSLTGTRFGCGVGQCGACTVQLSGEPDRACVNPVSAEGDREICTVEGLSTAQADALRAAWSAHAVAQCGFCQAGQLVAAENLLRRTPRPQPDAIRSALRGNLCRCGTYARIVRAIEDAASRLNR